MNEMTVDGFVSKKNFRSGNTQAGDAWAAFTVTNNYHAGKDDEGKPRYEKQWVEVSTFGRLAEQCIMHLDNEESQFVQVTGRFNLDTWAAKDGSEKTSLKLFANSINRGGGLNFFGENNPENRTFDNSGSDRQPVAASSVEGF